MNSFVQGRTVATPMFPLLRTVIIDDSISFGDLAAALLGREPFVDVVGVARSGAEALRLVANVKPDVVLIDVQMEPMSGLTTAMLISWIFPITRVLMMSTDDSPRLRADCAASGAQAFIHKSTFIPDFFAAIGPIARAVARERFSLRSHATAPAV